MTKATLSGQLREAARTGRGWLRRVLGRRREFKVRFPSDRDVLAALRADLPCLAQARTAADAGDLERACHRLMVHLSERSEPRFLVNPGDVRSLASRFASRHPEWRAEATRSAGEWTHHIYTAGEVPPGAEHVPDWSNLPLGPGSDTVYLYKPHSFLFAVQLARARVYGAQTDVVLRRLIESWLASSEGTMGASGYSSPLLAVHRAVALTWTLVFLAGSERRDLDLEFTILRILLADARFVYARLGTSFPNNHLLADGFLMLYLGLLYPEFREAEQWRSDGEALFLRELRRQIYEDGTSFEHSVHYHELVCEMVTAFVLLARRNGIAVEPWVEQRHRRMLEFQAVLGGPEARSFDIGDTVEGHLFPLDGFDGIGAASHREILRALYNPEFPPSHPGAPGLERAQWLLARSLEKSDRKGADQGSFEFPDGGYLVLADGALDGCLVFRTGPAPHALCSPGHMHADFLSVYLRLHATPIIVDAGTFTYRARKDRWPPDEPEWRAHFMSPAAHNALCIAGRDSLVRGPGDFPSGPLKSRVLGRQLAAGATVSWIEAQTVGDTPYDGHVRGVVQIQGRYWLVYDLLPASATVGHAWLSLHFSQDTSLRELGDHAAVVTVADAQLVVTTSQGARAMEWVKGSRHPVAGWVSPRYGELAAAAECRVATSSGPPVVATLLEPSSGGSQAPRLDIETTDSGAIGVRIARDNAVEYLLLSRDAPKEQVSLFGIDFQGTVLWLRAEGARPRELRALAGHKADSKSLGFSLVSRRGPSDLHLTFDGEATSAAARQEVDLVLALT